MALAAYTKLPYHFGMGRAFRPLSLFIEVTYRCNFRCNMCQFLNIMDDPRLNEKKGEELTLDEMRSAIDQVSRLGMIVFTGGEPLLRRDIMEAVRYASEKRKSYLVTNGVLLTEDISREFVSLGCRTLLHPGMASVGISLEGPEAVHDNIVNAKGSYQKIIGNVKKLVELKRSAGKSYPVIALKCVMTRHNANHLDELYRLAEEVGVDIFNPIAHYDIPNTNRLEMDSTPDLTKEPKPENGIDIGLLEKEIDAMVRRSAGSKVQLRLTPPALPPEDIVAIYRGDLDMSTKRCHTPWGTALLSAYGEVTPCSNYPAGNIRKEPFMKIWNGERMRLFRDKLKKNRIFPGCAACCSILPE